jgi:D-alanyl-D-alanine dipeptidase
VHEVEKGEQTACVRLGSTMLSSVSASSSFAPTALARTTVARSPTHVAPQTAVRMRRVAANEATPRSVWPVCGTTESSTSFATLAGCASAYRSPTKLP